MSRMLRAASFAVWLVAAASAAFAQGGERILDYTIEVNVGAQGAIDVVEEITVRAENRQIHRGIYRDFPTRYRDRYGNNVVVGFEMQGVQRDGVTEPWFTEQRSNGVRINTGSDAFLPRFPAEYRYTLGYRTTRQIGFFADHDELYFNAIGTGWDFAIERGRVEVRLPEAVPIERMQAEGYTGPQGARGSSYTARVTAPGVARWELTAPLAPHEGFTIVLSFPKAVIAEPTQADRARWVLADNRGLLAALGGLGLLLVYVMRTWRRIGRDPAPGVVIARFEPPQGRSPAELRYLKRRHYDNRCFTSDLLTSAVDGGVRIEREDRLLLGDRWQIERIENAAPGRFPSVNALIGGLFKEGVDTVELTQSNARRLMAASQAHAQFLKARLQGSHFKRNLGSVGVAALIGVATTVAALAISGGGAAPLIVAIGVLMALIVALFAYLVEAPTQEGRKLLDEIAGLKLYLSVAERDELASMKGPGAPPPLDSERYEGLLPYAVALDVEEAWTRKFTAAVGAAAAAEATARMVWYHGARTGDLGGLVKAVGSGLSSSIASASTPPGSTSGGGGGGFSGGGGGGGGGGGR
jgi:uncharacterized membrane protein YgcG